MSTVFFGGLMLAVAGFAVWVYERRELPIAGRRILATTRALSLALIVALLWNPRVPYLAGSVGAPGRWTLLDGSLSMNATGGHGVSAWSEGLERARSRARAGDRVMIFGSGLEVPAESLPASSPQDPASRLAPALERVAESGSRDVTVISDLRLTDAEAVASTLARLGVRASFDAVGGTPRNAAIPVAELPRLVESGDTVVVDVAVRATAASAGDTVVIEIREEGVLRASRPIPSPPQGRLTRLRIPLPPPAQSGLVRYEIRAMLPGDEFPDDDARVRFVDVDPEAGGLVLVSLSADWEPRFLLPVLEQVTGLPGHGYLSLTEGRFMPLSVADAPSAVVDAQEVQGRASSAELLVVHGSFGDAPQWLVDALAGARRSIVFVEEAAGAQALGLGVGMALPGEWYPSADLPPSALTSNLVGVPWTGLPPLTGVLPLNRVAPGRVPLELQLQGSGPAEAAMVLQGAQGRRQAVVLASGFWRWGFRDGSPREAYRRLWAGVVGWMLANEPLGTGPGVAPTHRLVRRGESVVWRAGGWTGQRLRVRLSSADTVVADTVLSVDPSGEMRTRVLPPGTYDFRVEAGDDGRLAGQGRFEVERFSEELLTPVYQPNDPAGGPAAGATVGATVGGERPGRPLRTHAFPYILLIGLLSGEWIGRRRRGLR